MKRYEKPNDETDRSIFTRIHDGVSRFFPGAIILATGILLSDNYRSSAANLAAAQGTNATNMATVSMPSPWYYHVKTGGKGGKPVQSEADPGQSNCWNSISAAFAAVRTHATAGPWIIQVDDEATYDESVNLYDFQTSFQETLSLIKAPWLAGRPTIYPKQPKKRALQINGLGPGSSGPLPGQPGQAARRITYFTLRGFALKNIAQGTDSQSDQPIFSDTQTYLTEGLHTIEDCDFNGQNQTYGCRIAVFINGTCINTDFRRNAFHHFRMKENPTDRMTGYVFVMTAPVSTVVGEPRVTMASNQFRDNQGLQWECLGDASNKRYYRVVFERNALTGNSAAHHSMVVITDNSLFNEVRNNLFLENQGPESHGTVSIWNAGNTKVYHNTLVNNHTGREVAVSGLSDNVEIKNNLFWPTPGGHLCVDVQAGYKGTLFCNNNAFYTDWKKDGYAPGSAFSTGENTEIVGCYNNVPLTTAAWNDAAKRRGGLWSFLQKSTIKNTGNGYTLGGPGLDRNGRLISGSLCIGRAVSGLVNDDLDGQPRSIGRGPDIGAFEYRSPTKTGFPVH